VTQLALVTGGCRRLGGGIAARLARAGYALAIHGSHDARPDAELTAVLAETGAQWRGFVADFTDPSAAAGLYGEVTQAFGRVPDLLVNGASVFDQDRLDSVTSRGLADAFAVNCAAAVLLVQAFAAGGMTGGRSVVNILDQRIVHPHPDQLAYTLAKLALAGFTRMPADGVRMNGVAPGLTLPTTDYDAAQMAALARRMPLRVLPVPDAIGNAVLFCASTPSLSGQILFVDGGAHLVAFERDFMHLDEPSGTVGG
jgi:NAD(P)-dependent dehydrogenase (short-subunit alcohol dehydrogenase family)